VIVAAAPRVVWLRFYPKWSRSAEGRIRDLVGVLFHEV